MKKEEIEGKRWIEPPMKVSILLFALLSMVILAGFEVWKFSDVSFKRGLVVGWVVGIVPFLGGFVGGTVLFPLPWVSNKRKRDSHQRTKQQNTKRRNKQNKVSMLDDLVTEMKLEDLIKLTENFDKDHIIGSGRSGTVYKAIPDTGCFLAIKRFEDSEHLERQFRAELTTLGKVMRHRNLVPLLSFCMAEEQRLLVYEYMTNRALFDWLHPMDQDKRKALEWPKRLRIGIGLARGLAWLHYNSDTRIIHRNLTSKSVLLDENFEPKISNFGFAMLLNWDEFQTNTSMISEAGDLDYVGLDYTQTPVPALKRDVYSFGIVLLELLTGEKPDQVTNAQGSFNGSLVEWIAHLSDKTSRLYSAIDKSLIGRGFDGEILQFLGVACNCVLSPLKERPKMFEVYKTLRAVGEGYEFIDNDDLLM